MCVLAARLWCSQGSWTWFKAMTTSLQMCSPMRLAILWHAMLSVLLSPPMPTFPIFHPLSSSRSHTLSIFSSVADVHPQKVRGTVAQGSACAKLQDCKLCLKSKLYGLHWGFPKPQPAQCNPSYNERESANEASSEAGAEGMELLATISSTCCALPVHQCNSTRRCFSEFKSKLNLKPEAVRKNSVARK